VIKRYYCPFSFLVLLLLWLLYILYSEGCDSNLKWVILIMMMSVLPSRNCHINTFK